MIARKKKPSQGAFFALNENKKSKQNWPLVNKSHQPIIDGTWKQTLVTVELNAITELINENFPKPWK